MNDTDKAFTITLKGWLAGRVINCTTIEEFCELWADLGAEILHTTGYEGSEEAIPALVLTDRGTAIVVKGLATEGKPLPQENK